jgi:protein TonB
MGRAFLYALSIGVHGALAVGVISLEGKRVHEATTIAIVNAKKPPPKTETPPPPPPPPEAPKAAKAKAAPQPAKAPEPVAAAPAAPSGGDAIPDFGVSLGGSTGPGMAVPKPNLTAAPAPTVERSKKVLSAAAPAQPTCDEPPKKPKVIDIAQPAFTREAREANVSGRVRVEITVDTTGKVTAVRVLEGLGYGLDEAAMAAARAATFEPGTRCGVPAQATFVVAMRFAL